jgi:hypothetical protein
MSWKHPLSQTPQRAFVNADGLQPASQELAHNEGALQIGPLFPFDKAYFGISNRVDRQHI